MRATLSSFPRITKLEWINKLMGMQVSETKTKFNAHMLSSKVVEKKNTLYVWVNNWITHKKFIISFSHIATEPETTADILAPLQKDRTTPSLACLKNKNKTFKKCKKKKKKYRCWECVRDFCCLYTYCMYPLAQVFWPMPHVQNVEHSAILLFSFVFVCRIRIQQKCNGW